MQEDQRAELRAAGVLSFFVARMNTQRVGEMPKHVDVRIVPRLDVAKQQCVSLANWLDNYSGQSLIDMPAQQVAQVDAGLFLTSVMLSQDSIGRSNLARDLLAAHENYKAAHKELYAHIEELRGDVDPTTLREVMTTLLTAVL